MYPPSSSTNVKGMSIEFADTVDGDSVPVGSLATEN